MKEKFVVVDLETTGNSPKKGDRIIQIGAVVIENRQIVDQFSTFIQPEKPIPKFIEELTGINDELVAEAPLFSQVAPKILELLDHAYFVAHNVLFDLSFLQDELQGNGYEGFYGSIIDTVELARILLPTENSYKLKDLALSLGFSHDRPHQADSDAFVTAEVFLYLLRRLEQLPKETLEKLWPLSCHLKSDIALLINDCLMGKMENYDHPHQDLQFVNGLYIRKSFSEHIERKSNPFPFPSSKNGKIELLKKGFPQYEERTGQLDMMDKIYEAMMGNRHALIEAGPGIGKTISYLLPSYHLAIEKNEPVIISTYTTQLQHQLIEKDIPILEKIVGTPVHVALLKGRSHYIHVGKFIESLQEDNDTYDLALLKMQIIIWLMETETGDKDELKLSMADEYYWKEIECKNDDHSLLNFYVKAKNKAQNAQLIITNHSFLIHDLHRKERILPPFNYCIIDEGHQLEQAAINYFAQSIHYITLKTLIYQFHLTENKQYNDKLHRLLKKMNHQGRNRGNTLYSQVIMEIDEFFQMLKIYFKKQKKMNQSFRQSCIINKNIREWTPVFHSGEKLYFALKDLVQYIEEKVEICRQSENLLEQEDFHFLHQLEVYTSQLKETCQILKRIMMENQENEVYWIEMDGQESQNSMGIYQQPLFVREFLKETLFQRKNSVVITSATLTVNESFNYIMESLGLKGTNCLQVTIDSPFQYEEKVQLIVANDLPEVNQVSLDEYVAAISEHIISIGEVMGGKMLVLFTSYEMLTATYQLIKESELLADYLLIGQGVTSGSIHRLAKIFQSCEKAILFGTSSFWEGVDFPGEDLSCLIVVRLPFSSPYEPKHEGRYRQIEKEGKNSFSQLSLPEAVIRFKQGFGRLIRTENDRGIVIVFDKRLVTTSYGKTFIQSIPRVPIYISNLDQILRKIKDFFKL